jgi:hypothetical protein
MFIVWPAGERRLEVWSMRQETIVSVAWFAALREAPEGSRAKKLGVPARLAALTTRVGPT